MTPIETFCIFTTIIWSHRGFFPNPLSADYPVMMIMKFPNSPTSWQKMPFLHVFQPCKMVPQIPPQSKVWKTVQTPNPIKTDVLHAVIKCLWFLPPWERGMKTCQHTWCMARWDGLYDGARWLRHGGWDSSVDVRRRDILHHLDADQGVWAVGLGLHCDQVHQQVWNKAHAAASEHK